MKTGVFFAGLLLLIGTPAGARLDAGGFANLSFRQHPGRQLPLATLLTDETGHQRTLGSVLSQRPSVIILEYLRCQNLCSLVLSGAANAMARAQLLPGKDVDLVAVSIDPRDTSKDAAKLQGMYSRRFVNSAAAARGLHFLTGSSNQVAKIANAIGFPFAFDQQSKQFAHPAGFVVVTPDGRISRYILGLNPSPATLRQAVTEARTGAITPPAHPLLLLCFGYDPDAGTAAALAVRLVRYVYLAALVVCALVAAGFWLRRRGA